MLGFVPVLCGVLAITAVGGCSKPVGTSPVPPASKVDADPGKPEKSMPAETAGEADKELVAAGRQTSPLPKEIVEVWTEAGASIGWGQAEKQNVTEFKIRAEGVPGELPLISFLNGKVRANNPFLNINKITGRKPYPQDLVVP